MREHPVPQNVTSYEFHLIGNMTLKQFLELAAGIVVGVIIYSTNLPGVIKWPLIVFFAGVGAMIAFVPFEGRPLDQWFFAFIKAIYRPTQFYWKKAAKIPDFFTYTKTTDKTFEPEFDYRPIKHQRIQEFIKTLPSTEESISDYEERQRAQSMISLFDQVQVEEIVVEKQQQKPTMNTAPRNLQPINQVAQDLASSEIQTTNIAAKNISQTAVDQQPLAPPDGQTNHHAPQPIEVIIPDQNIPIIETATTPQSQPTQDKPTNLVSVFSSTQQQNIPQSSQPAVVSQSLPFPQKPSIPNVVVGMVFDQNGAIVNNAIVEIVDEQGMPVRAVKTNAIGQFSISTPLQNGNYFVQIEKAPLAFSPLQLSLQQTYLDPLDIRAVS